MISIIWELFETFENQMGNKNKKKVGIFSFQ